MVSKESIKNEMNAIVEQWKCLIVQEDGFDKKFRGKYDELKLDTDSEEGYITVEDQKGFKWGFSWDGSFDDVQGPDGEFNGEAKPPVRIQKMVDEFIGYYTNCFTIIEKIMVSLGYITEQRDFSHMCYKDSYKVDVPYWCDNVDDIDIIEIPKD